MRRSIVLCSIALAGAASAVAVATAGSAPPTVAARLSEFKIAPTPQTVAAGKVTFVARNAGALEHELVVVRTGKDAGKLGLANGTASEAGAVGEIEDVKPGSTRRMTLDLKPGHYVLLCNVGKHYKAGMRVNFTVKGATTVQPAATSPSQAPTTTTPTTESPRDGGSYGY